MKQDGHCISGPMVTNTKTKKCIIKVSPPDILNMVATVEVTYSGRFLHSLESLPV